VSRRIKELRKTAAAAAASAGEETPTAEPTLCLSYASPELLRLLREDPLPTGEPSPEAALGTRRFPFKSSSEIDTEMEEAIRLGDARNAARLGQELERAKSREFLAARESAAQAQLWRTP
jgi:hypothetical protein